MRYIIRNSAFISFIFLSVFGLACSVSTAKKQTETDINKPLVLPQQTSDKPKIIAFGDSLTAGFGLAETESYPYLLQRKLAADGAFRAAEAHAGRPAGSHRSGDRP